MLALDLHLKDSPLLGLVGTRGLTEERIEDDSTPFRNFNAIVDEGKRVMGRSLCKKYEGLYKFGFVESLTYSQYERDSHAFLYLHAGGSAPSPPGSKIGSGRHNRRT